MRTSFRQDPRGSGCYRIVHNSDSYRSNVTVHIEGLDNAWQTICLDARIQDEYTFEQPPVCLNYIADAPLPCAILTIHHALYDGTTLPKLIDDLDRAIRGQPVQVRPKFGDLLPHLLSRPVDVRYWANHLFGCPLLQHGHRVIAVSGKNGGSVRPTCQLSSSTVRAKVRAREVSVSVRSIATLPLARFLGS